MIEETQLFRLTAVCDFCDGMGRFHHRSQLEITRKADDRKGAYEELKKRGWRIFLGGESGVDKVKCSACVAGLKGIGK